MTAEEILAEFESLGRDGYKKIMLNHGVKEPCFGVKIEDMKKFQKQIKMDYQLAKDLYDTGVYDAMYFAGLIADDAKMTKKDLKRWVEGAYCHALCQWTVGWVAAGSPHGFDMALEWIDSKKPNTAIAGWATLTSLVSIKDDDELDLAEFKKLLQRVGKTIHDQPDRVRYAMNAFVISVGCYVSSLTELALKTAAQMGQVTVDMGDTSCKVPSAADYIKKVQARKTIGKKRKTCKC